MSGGSYDYVSLADDITVLFEKMYQLEALRDRLASLGYAKDAAMETERLIATLRQFEVQTFVAVERLRPVWKAIEWWDSCDRSEAQFRESLAEYRGEKA